MLLCHLLLMIPTWNLTSALLCCLKEPLDAYLAEKFPEEDMQK